MPTILVVDDEASIRRTLREILEYEDFGVEEAENGEEALAAKATVTLTAMHKDKMPESLRPAAE
mgnify:CR=1 FL=1